MENIKKITATLSIESWYTEVINEMCPLLKSCVKRGMSKELAVEVLVEISRMAIREAVNIDFKKEVVINIDSPIKIERLAEELEFYLKRKNLNNNQ